MKKIIIALTLLLSVTSCVEMLFEQPQPAGVKTLKQMPKALQGSYVADEKDTLQITATSFKGFEDDKGSVLNLSENLVIKKYKKHYFVSKKHESGLWEVVIITRDNNDNLQFKFIDGDDEEKTKRLEQFIDVETKYDSVGKAEMFIINPSKKELMGLMDKEVFEELPLLKRIK